MAIQVDLLRLGLRKRRLLVFDRRPCFASRYLKIVEEVDKDEAEVP